MEEGYFPLHPAQLDVFIAQLIDPTSPRFNTGGILKLTGTLDLTKFIELVNSVLVSFDVFKMRFDYEKTGLNHGYIDKSFETYETKLIDFSTTTNPEQSAFLWAQNRFNLTFEINGASLLFEQYLLKISNNEHWLFARFHHLISDGYGFSIYSQKIANQYHSTIDSGNNEVSPSYISEALKASNYYKSPGYILEENYWKSRLDGHFENIFQKKNQNKVFPQNKSSLYIYELNDEKRAFLSRLSFETQFSIPQLTIAALLIYFGKSSSHSDFVFGTSIHRRTSRNLRKTLGMFTGILPFNGKFSSDDVLIDLLNDIKQKQRQDYRYQNYLESDLNQLFKGRSDDGRFFQVIINYELFNFNLNFGDQLNAIATDLSSEYEINPLLFGWRDYGEQQSLLIRISFLEDYFSIEEIEYLVQRVIFILEQFQSCLYMEIGKIDIVPTLERERLRDFGAAHRKPVDETKGEFSLHNILFNKIAKNPDSKAVVYRNECLIYRELDERSNQLGHYLRESFGSCKRDRVAVFIERSEWIVVILLSLLKNGITYVPIDPNLPKERVLFILDDVKPSLIITEESKLDFLGEVKYRSVTINSILTAIGGYETAANTDIDICFDEEAYIIYTSGSTGKPKGVVVTHGNLNHFCSHVYYQYLTSNPAVLPLIASNAFDISLFQLLTPIMSGGTVVIVDNEQVQDMPSLVSLLGTTTMIDTVPSLFHSIAAYIKDNNLVSSFNHIERIFIGGDRIPDDLLVVLSEVFNSAIITVTYGPTEGTIFCTDLEYVPGSITSECKGSVIGHPIDKSELYILSNGLELSPLGVIGEICIGGSGLARGYLNRAELTAEKFIKHPYSAEAGSRLYRTGDLGRWLPDGNIEFIGRLDDQVKIRGYRIELGEIESVLGHCELVSQAVVLAREDQGGNKRLVGYIVPEGDFDKEGVLGYLRSRLPEYMVPSLLLALTAMPLTSNGKVDRRSLPDPDLAELLSEQYVAPRNGTEEELAQIWQELLNVDRIGIHDNFFELGGDSIITIQLVSRMKRSGYEVKPKDIFIHQTIGRLSVLLTEREGILSAGNGEQGILSGRSGLLPVQQWYLDSEPSAVSHFNQSVLLKLDKDVTGEMLARVTGVLLAHHDALRFVYSRTGSGLEQSYSPEIRVPFFTEQVSRGESGLQEELIREISNKYQEGLDIEGGDLLRVVLLETGDAIKENRLLIVIHHLVVDGVSWRILLDDLDLLLGKLHGGEQLDLGNKSSSYRQWYDGLALYAQGRPLLSQRSYWEKIAGSYVRFRTDKAYTGSFGLGDTGKYKLSLPAEQTRILLHEASSAYHTEINDLLLCSLAMTLSQWQGVDKVVIGLEGHGREDVSEGLDTSRTVGWFTNLYPVLLECGQETAAGALIKSIKEQLRQVPDKGLGYGVLKYLNKEPLLQGVAPWDLVFNYLGQLDNIVSSSEWFTGSGESSGDEISKTYTGVDKLSVNSNIQGGELVLTWGYSRLHYEEATIAKLASRYIYNLDLLLRHCVEQGQQSPVYTPSDYGLGKEISYGQLDAFLAKENNGGGKAGASITSMYRLSGLQEGMLFHGLYAEHSGGYVEQFSCELTDVDVPVFLASWHHLLKSHSILRSSFHYEEFSIPVQCVHGEVDLPVSFLDYRNLSEVEQESAVSAYLLSDRRKGFEFRSAPLMRIGLIRINAGQYKMIWTHHHMLLDGWSVQVMMKELLSTYELLSSGDRLPLITEDLYEDYIRYIERRDKEKEEHYWRGYLAGVESGTLLPFITGPSSERNKGIGSYGEEYLRIDGVLTGETEKYIQDHHVTMNTLMQGIWSYLLHSYTGNRSITYGVTVSGRPNDLPGMEDRVGMYINTLPLHSVAGGGDRITDWLQQLQQSQLESREYQHTVFSDIQKWTNVPGDLFDSLLVFENYPVSKVIRSRSWSLQVSSVEVTEQTNYPLSISIVADKEISISFSYNTHLLSSGDVHRIAGHFEHVLKQVISNTKETLGELELLTAAERKQLLEDFNDTNADYPRDKTVVELFTAQAMQTPEAVAVVFEEQELSYRELDERSNQLGHYLRGKGVKAETLVPICVDRGLEMIVGILGILKAGGAYVPIDPEYPRERMSYMLEDIGAEVIIRSSFRLPVIHRGVIIELDTDWQEIRNEPVSPVDSGLTPANVAYVIYTSGSTGKPKGVVVEHRNVVSIYYAWKDDYDLASFQIRLLQLASMSFDVFSGEICRSLLIGGTLVICPNEIKYDLSKLYEYIKKHRINIFESTPSLILPLLKQIGDQRLSFDFMKVLIIGSDTLKAQSYQHLRDLYASKFRIINSYGTTETTIDSLYFEGDVVGNTQNGVMPIGKPYSNTNVYILNNTGQQQPIGVPGELYIGGLGVSRGYLKRENLTSKRFLDNPFNEGKMYRTGDLGRWLADGNIEFLGRVDDQVKIRGYRIELGEIESILAQCELVSGCVVLAHEDGKGNKRLVGYVVPNGAFDKEGIQWYLRERLPEYMVPAILVELAMLPLTPNGKIDRKALPDPDMERLLSGLYVAPRTETELKLAEIWQDLLGVEHVGINDNFFELGGHSLLVTRVVSAIRVEMSLSLSIRTLFDCPTINELNNYIASNLSDSISEENMTEFDNIDL